MEARPPQVEAAAGVQVPSAEQDVCPGSARIDASRPSLSWLSAFLRPQPA